MSFKDRYGLLGDEAETVYEQVADKIGMKYVRYGLCRPPIQVHALPERIRYTPDYLCRHVFVEVQGYGRDNAVKLKLDKWRSLWFWNGIHPVDLFLWDRTNRRWCFVPLDQLDELAGGDAVKFKKFAEGKPYLQFRGDDIFEVSDLVGELPDGEST